MIDREYIEGKIRAMMHAGYADHEIGYAIGWDCGCYLASTRWQRDYERVDRDRAIAVSAVRKLFMEQVNRDREYERQIKRARRTAALFIGLAFVCGTLIGIGTGTPL